MTTPPREIGSPETPEGRAVWLREVGGFSIEEIGWRLGIPSERVAALLARKDAVQVGTAGEAALRVMARSLSKTLLQRFRLRKVILAPRLQGRREGELVATAAAEHLASILRKRSAPRIVGLSHGRTLAKMVETIPSMTISKLIFVSLLGELTQNATAYPYVIMPRLAEKFRAAAYPMPAPLYTTTSAEMALFKGLPNIATAMKLWADADLWVVGIGVSNARSQLFCNGMLQAADLDEIAKERAVCEVLGRFYDSDGREISANIGERTLSPPASLYEGRHVIGVAGGAEKVDAIRAALRGGLISELVTDAATAISLLDDNERSDFQALVLPDG